MMQGIYVLKLNKTADDACKFYFLCTVSAYYLPLLILVK